MITRLLLAYAQFTNLSEMSDHYQACLTEELCFFYYHFHRMPNRWDPRPELAALANMLITRLQYAACQLFDHDYQPNGCDAPESGGEGFTCARCGLGFTAWH